MKLRMLDLLICPECQKPEQLKLEVYSEFKANLVQENKAEVETGVLTCSSCTRQYPIINGIPRMLPDNLISNLLSYHSDFFQKHNIKLPESIADEIVQAKKRTLSSFSFQWNVFSEMYEDYERSFLGYIHPIQPDFFPGKLGFDGGCGFGRHIHYAAKYGAEMIGLDLSEAVEAAFRNNRHLSNVHIVQGDIYNPPFRKGTFDFVYSIGVLHHLPDPKEGFASLSHLLKPNAAMFIWVYSYTSSNRRELSDAIAASLRKVTTKMSYQSLYIFCYVIAGFVYLTLHIPTKILSRIPGFKCYANRIFLSELSSYPFKVSVTNTFDRLSVPIIHYHNEEELQAWYEEAGLEIIAMSRKNKRSIRVLGRANAIQ